jgi:LmbE family N-acetylglucosaminyl deacetylase
MISRDDQRRTRGGRRENSGLRTLRVLRFTSCVALASAVLRAGPEPLPQDKGAAGAWQRLLKLQTTASAMHTTAHPDDEHGGVLAQLSRGLGARVSLLTLTRGESGDNAIGSELFDAVGLIRTEELLLAGRYYGLDRQYFTTAVDYGFSKRLEEALVKWGRENVLRDVVRIMRMDRPLVVIARFQGNERDGHGNHQAAGLITQEAYRVAGDASVFPEQIRDGLRPWQPLKLYMGGVRENEEWTLRADTAEYSPWLGATYQAFARIGLGYQRSQNGGRVGAAAGSAPSYYTRLAEAPQVRLTSDAAHEASFFDGIDTTLPGLFTAIGRQEPPGAAALLNAIDGEVKNAVRAFSIQKPSACVPALARGLAATRRAIELLSAEQEAVFVLRVKEDQFIDAINTALGIDFQAIADVRGPAVPGQRLQVGASFTNGGAMDIDVAGVELMAAAGWRIERTGEAPGRLRPNDTAHEAFIVTVPADAPPTRPYFERASIQESRYTIRRDETIDAKHAKPADPGFLCAFCGFCVERCDPAYRPAAEPAATAVARYAVAGVPVEARAVVRRREPHLPYGDELRELMVVPAVAVDVSPRMAIVPATAPSRTAVIPSARKPVDLRVDLMNNVSTGSSGRLGLRLPSGWTSSPAGVDFTFARPGERGTYRFRVSVPSVQNREYRIEAIATLGGREYAQGYDVVEHRDLETRYLYHPAAITVRGVDVAIAPNLEVGYVMGIGDDVPAGIAQLGASVSLLGERELATENLRRFDAIVTGTRAYAVRDDLKTYSRRLLDYVRDGGNLIVLYNTQELVPNDYAPYPAQLTARAEEVSEEDSPVEILAPQHRVFNAPNRITSADFDGWVEQRGSKFFSEWDRAYTPMIATHDTGQAWQKGGWLTADYGKGHYTYFAYALHRQLPYGVAGAYRLLANLLSLGK